MNGRSGSLRLSLLTCLVLAIITFAAFYQVIGHDFINHDDDVYVYGNQHVQQGLTLGSVKWALSAVYVGTWQPVVWLSYMLDRQVFGQGAWGFHLTNLLLHIANVLLLFLVLQIMTGKPWRSAFVALLFAIHPLHVESVAWVAERKDVLSTLFWLLTMWAYIRYARDGGVYRYLGVTVFFVLGLMAKPMLVVLPFVLLLMDYWPLKRASLGIRKLVLEKVPLLAVALLSGVLTVSAQNAAGALASTETFGLGVRVANALVVYVSYLAKTVWPVGLALPYPYPGNTLPIWQVLGSLAVLLVISALVFGKGRRHPFLAVGWLWYLITLVPVIGLVQFGWTAMADRFTYLPLIGLFLMVTWGVGEWANGRMGERETGRKGEPNGRIRIAHSPVLPLSATLVVAALIGCTHVQVGYWKNSVTLFEHTVKVTGDNPVADSCLGAAYFRMKEYDRAVVHYRKALAGEPGQAGFHFKLANALYENGNLKEAVEQYSETLKIDPGFPDARSNYEAALAELNGRRRKDSDPHRGDPRHQQALEHLRLGTTLNAQNRLDEAIAELEEAIRLEPDLAEAHSDLGVALGRNGDNEGAIRECREAIRLAPKLAEAHLNLALGLYMAGDYAGSWKEVHLAQRYGATANPKLLEYLASKMPEPPE